MIGMLQDRVGLIAGAPYRGRVVTMEQLGRAEPIGWMDIATKIGSRYAATGNDYAMIGLWHYGIPTLFEYSPAMSPAFFSTVTRLLALPTDVQMRNVIVLRRPDAHALGILGVRFVIADAPLPEPFRLVMSERTFKDEVLSLYEVPEVNLGTTAPTEVKVVTRFDEALGLLAAPGFDAKHSVIVFDAALAAEHLNPVDAAEVRMIPGGLSVEATSAGRSMLVLPFEFSHCLHVRSRVAEIDPPILFRVDAVETGVLFDRYLAADIEYFTGLFQNSGCRVRDARDFSLLSAK